MFSHNKDFQKDAAWAAFKKTTPANKKIGSGSTLKVAAPAPQHWFNPKMPILLYSFVKSSKKVEHPSSFYV